MDRSGQKALAVIMYLVALALIGVGFYTMYRYGDAGEYALQKDNAGHIVGGDAYNYIIIAVRGVGWIVAGLAAAVMGAVASINAGQGDSLDQLVTNLAGKPAEAAPAQQPE